MSKDRNQATPAAYLIIEREGKILLVRRINTGYQDGNYSLPSGHIERSETPTECIIRETCEEIGIILQALSLQNVVYDTKMLPLK